MPNLNIIKNKRIISIIFFFLVLIYSCSLGLFPAAYETIQEEFSKSWFELFLLDSLFLFISALAMLFFGYYSDKTTRKWLFVLGGSIWCVFSTAIYFSSYYLQILIFRAISAIGIGAFLPVGFSIISDLSMGKKRAKTFGYFSFAIALGTVLGIGVSAFTLETLGWRFPFLIFGILIIFFMPIIILIKEPMRGQSDVLELGGAEYSYKIKLKDLKYIWSRKSNAWLILNGLYVIPAGMMVFAAITFLQEERAVTVQNATLAFIIIGIGFLFGPLIFGYLGDLWYKKNKRGRIYTCIFCNFVSLPLIFLGIIVPFNGISDPKSLIFIIAILIGLTINSGIGPNWYSSLVDVNLPENRGSMLSMATIVDALFKAIGPILCGFLADLYSFQFAFIIAIIIWAISGIFWLPPIKYIVSDMIFVKKIIKDRIEKENEN
jgi:MFS family permease